MNGPSIALATNILNGVSPDWVIKGMGDFNGDGKSDILWYNTATHDVGVWELNGPSILLPATVGNAGPNSVPVGTGDYNSDDRSDILLQNTDGTPTIWTMNSTTVTSITTLADPGQTWHAIAR